MKIKIKNKTYNIPTGLSQITLRQRIEFDEIHLKDIQTNNEYLKDFAEGPEREMEEMIVRLDLACRCLSHFAGIPLEDIQKTNMEKVIIVYDSCFKELFNELNNVELLREHYFQGEIWEITAPELTYKSDTTFNEFIVSKQIIKKIHELGQGQWAAVPFLAAVYLRKEGEAFDEEMVVDESPRIELMYDLPMDIANQVAFFLSNSITMYQQIFRSFPDQEVQKVQT